MTEKQKAIQYYQTLAVKLHDYQLVNVEDVTTQGLPWGLRANFMHNPTGNKYQSVWVYEPHRGKGMMSSYVVGQKVPFITQISCGIYEWFESRRVTYVMIPEV